MTKIIPYWLYKTGYTDFPVRDYDAAAKTIVVDLPEYKKVRFPKNWVKSGNRYLTPNGCEVVFWATGLAENFIVITGCGNARKEKTFPAGLYVREKVIAYVDSF